MVCRCSSVLTSLCVVAILHWPCTSGDVQNLLPPVFLMISTTPEMPAGLRPTASLQRMERFLLGSGFIHWVQTSFCAHSLCCCGLCWRRENPVLLSFVFHVTLSLRQMARSSAVQSYIEITGCGNVNSDLFVHFFPTCFYCFYSSFTSVQKKKKKSIRRSETDISEWNRECKISVWPWHCSCWNINGIKCRWIGNVCSGQRFLQAVFPELCPARVAAAGGASPLLPRTRSDRGDEDGTYRCSLSLIGKAVRLIRLNRQRGLFGCSWKTHQPAGKQHAFLHRASCHCPALATEAWGHRWLCWGESGPPGWAALSPRCQASPAMFIHSFCVCML